MTHTVRTRRWDEKQLGGSINICADNRMFGWTTSVNSRRRRQYGMRSGRSSDLFLIRRAFSPSQGGAMALAPDVDGKYSSGYCRGFSPRSLLVLIMPRLFAAEQPFRPQRYKLLFIRQSALQKKCSLLTPETAYITYKTYRTYPPPKSASSNFFLPKMQFFLPIPQ